MIQRTLFDDVPQPVLSKPVEKHEELSRVLSKTEELIMSFRRRKGCRKLWRSEDLHRYVRFRKAVAPASCNRILRELRRDGQLNYQVINRAQSTYRFTEPKAE